MRRCSILALAFLVLVPLLFEGTSLAQIRVTPSGGIDPETNDGSDWEKALSGGKLAELLSGTSQGSTGGEYWLAAGVYPQLRPHRGTHLLGGFSGMEESREERDPDRHITYIAGIYLASYEIRSPEGELLDTEHPDHTTVVEGCTIISSSGVAFVATAEIPIGGPPLINRCVIEGGTGAGALISVVNGMLRVVDTEIHSGRGVGAYVIGHQGILDLIRCHIHNQQEAGVVALGGYLRITDSLIEENGTAFGERAPVFRFAGISVDDAEVEIRRTRILRNKGGHGAGLYLLAKPGTNRKILVEDCEIIGNSADAPLTGGGGVYASAYQPASPDAIVLKGCRISGNYARARGGGVYLWGSGTRITQCWITENTTDGHGGGVSIHGNPFEPAFTPLSIRHSLVANNSAAGNGGGFHMESSDAEVVNCTIANNSAAGRGGGIHSEKNRTPDGTADRENQRRAQFANCAITGNSAAEGSALYHTWLFYQGQFNRGPAEPRFHHCGFIAGETRLLNHLFGPNETLTLPEGSFLAASANYLDQENGDYRLTSASFLVDRGDNSHLLPAELDIDGQPRISGASVDIGAFEFDGAAQAPVLKIFRLPDGRLRLSGEGRLQHSRSLSKPTWEDVLGDLQENIAPEGPEGYWRLVR